MSNRNRVKRLADVLDFTRRQRNEIRIAAHEGKPLAVGGDRQDIAGTDNAAPAGAAGPMHHRSARKMPTATHQRDAVPERERIAVPQFHRGAFAHDPVPIRGVEMDRTVEDARPLVHRRIEVRVRDRDRLQAPEAFDHAHGRRIERGDAIPQDVAALRAHE